jgi:hypothetical protein
VKLDDKITFILWVIELSGLIGLGITIEDVMIIWAIGDTEGKRWNHEWEGKK